MPTYEQFKMPDIFLLKNAPILKSRHDFELWYLKDFESNIFQQEELNELLDEVCPQMYPCIPLRSSSSFDVIFITPEMVSILYEKIIYQNPLLTKDVDKHCLLSFS